MSLKETLPPIKNGKIPTNIRELWKDFNPRKEPLDVEVLAETEQEGIILKAIRIRVGIFKGKKAMLACIYGYPKGGTNLPALLQIHGGGQSAHFQAPLCNAKRGYATISIAWAGRLNFPDYVVAHPQVKAFLKGDKKDKNYKVTTDWGAIDAYHDPCRFPENFFTHNKPSESTLDAENSPRNSGWFFVTMGARRAVTFLEKQKEADRNRIGVYGHSMGGKLTVFTTGTDSRIKAAAPSCGGMSDRKNKDTIFKATLTDDHYLKNIKVPLMFLSPANDFHGTIDDLQTAIKELDTNEWRMTCSPNHNHQDTAPYEVATLLWMDQHLKDSFDMPKTPKSTVTLKTNNGVPSIKITPDRAEEVKNVDVFYTEQHEPTLGPQGAMTRFWHYAKATKKGKVWTADIPMSDPEKPLWVYANATYPLEEPVIGAGYYYEIYTANNYILSSRMHMYSPKQLATAGVKANLKKSSIIEDFNDEWEKEWFHYNEKPWELRTLKLNHPLFQGPDAAKLCFEVKSEQDNKLVLSIDHVATEVDIKGNKWKKVSLMPSDFISLEKYGIINWKGLKEFRFLKRTILRKGSKTKKLGGTWKGPKPVFKNLRWVKTSSKEMNASREFKLGQAKQKNGKTMLNIKQADFYQGSCPMTMNKTAGNKETIKVDGKKYTYGLSSLAKYSCSFYLAGKYKSFSSIALAGNEASVIFEIHIDGKLAYNSLLIQKGEYKNIEVSVKNANDLTLVVKNNGHNKHQNIATWVNASLQ